MELVQLEQFVAVARSRNFTRAAEDVGLSQSALSRSIQRLEETVGRSLFERRPRGVVLTDTGDWFLERARRVLQLLEETADELSELEATGRIRLGVIPTIGPYFLPEILRSFGEKFPNVAVVVTEDTTENLNQACSRGEIDLAILAEPVSANYLEVEPLFDEELLLVLPPEHPLEKVERIELGDIDALPFVMLNETHCLSENIAAVCRRELFQPITVERTSQLTTVQELVSLGHGVSMIPEMARRLDQGGRRIYRSLDGEKPTRRVVMMWNPYRFVSRWMKLLQQHLRDSVA
ncbi:MAG: LysR family transcriptional regulator [Verrucomicrobiota bacterium]